MEDNKNKVLIEQIDRTLTAMNELKEKVDTLFAEYHELGIRYSEGTVDFSEYEKIKKKMLSNYRRIKEHNTTIKHLSRYLDLSDEDYQDSIKDIRYRSNIFISPRAIIADADKPIAVEKVSISNFGIMPWLPGEAKLVFTAKHIADTDSFIIKEVDVPSKILSTGESEDVEIEDIGILDKTGGYKLTAHIELTGAGKIEKPLELELFIL